MQRRANITAAMAEPRESPDVVGAPGPTEKVRAEPASTDGGIGADAIHGAVALPASAPIADPLSASASASASAPASAEAAAPDAAPDASAPEAAVAPGALTASYRILPPAVERDVTLLIALGIVLFLNVSYVVGGLDLLPLSEAPDPEREKDKRGQVEYSEVVTVELVEDPDAASRSKVSRIGADAPPAPATETPPAEDAPPQDDVKPQPEQAEVAKPDPKQAKPERPQPEPREPGRELSIADFDLTMDAYKEAVERAEARRKLTPQQRAAEQQRIGGAAPQGKQSAFAKSVINALAKNKPKFYLTGGEAYIEFQLNRDGTIQYVRVVQSSGDPLLDKTAVDAIRTTAYPVAPPDVDPRDLRWLIHVTSF